MCRGSVQYFMPGLGGGEPASCLACLLGVSGSEVTMDTSLSVDGDKRPRCVLIDSSPGRLALALALEASGKEPRRTGRKPRGSVSLLVGVVCVAMVAMTGCRFGLDGLTLELVVVLPGLHTVRGLCFVFCMDNKSHSRANKREK